VVSSVSWSWLQSGMVMMVLVRSPWGVMILSVTTLLLASPCWLVLGLLGTALKILRLSDLVSLVPWPWPWPWLLLSLAISTSTWVPELARISRTWLMVRSTRVWPLILTILSPAGSHAPG